MTIKTLAQLDQLLKVLKKHRVEALRLGTLAVQFPSKSHEQLQSAIGFAVESQADDDTDN